MKSSRFTYRCAGCGASATKEPTGKKHGLHGWQCSGGCGRGVKVVRKLNKEKE